MKKEINWKEILVDSSRKCVENARDILIKNQNEFPVLLELSLKGEKKYSGRAIRTICYALQVDDKLFKKEILELIPRYKEIPDESVEFHFLEIFFRSELPKNEDVLAELTNICFDCLIRKVDKIAIKVYAADILLKIVKKYPDLKREFIGVLKSQSEDEHLSLRTTSKRIINELSKIK